MFTPRRKTPLNYDHRILAFDLAEAVTRRKRERKHCHSVQIGYLESGATICAACESTAESPG